MKYTHLLVTISIFIFASNVETAIAQVHGFHVQQIDNGGQGELANTVTNDILIDFTGNLRGQQLILELTAGSIFQHPAGSRTPPIQNQIDLDPSLAYDSFLSIGGLTAESTYPILVVGGLCGIDKCPDKFDTDGAHIAWVPGTGIDIATGTDFLTARLTLSGDAQGTWKYFGSVADSGHPFLGGIVTNGIMIVPEPITPILAVPFFLISIRSGRSTSPSFKGASR